MCIRYQMYMYMCMAGGGGDGESVVYLNSSLLAGGILATPTILSPSTAVVL